VKNTLAPVEPKVPGENDLDSPRFTLTSVSPHALEQARAGLNLLNRQHDKPIVGWLSETPQRELVPAIRSDSPPVELYVLRGWFSNLDQVETGVPVRRTELHNSDLRELPKYQTRSGLVLLRIGINVAPEELDVSGLVPHTLRLQLEVTMEKIMTQLDRLNPRIYATLSQMFLSWIGSKNFGVGGVTSLALLTPNNGLLGL
jgi:hypothetical protein